MSTSHKIELLAPAKNLEQGKTAINYGADAVYMGADKFGARAAAGNSMDDIAEMVQFAHAYGAKVFVTLNTILYDNELEEAKQLIHEIYRAGADALIIQDMAILKMDIPPIPLHASTQAHNFDIEKIQFLDKMDLERIVLARELSIPEIEKVRSSVNAELEYFIHGALCVSLSGQCYFSQAITGRSANRGECAQMCRHPYNLVDSNGKRLALNKHLLSLKDLNNSSNLEALVDAGITSFKIEGRLKDANYVKNIVSYYRQKLDALMVNNPRLDKASSGSTKISFHPDPERSFNRFSTDYFANSREQGMINPYSPKSMGKYLGKIKLLTQDYIEVDSKDELNNGDGLCYIQEDQLKGLRVEKVVGNKVYVNELPGLTKGLALYRNYDHEFTKQLENDKGIRKVKAKVEICLIDEQLSFIIRDEDGLQSTFTLDALPELANNVNKALSSMQSQLAKSGTSMFDIEKVEIQLQDVYFFRISELNEIRRALFAKHEETRRLYYQRIDKSRNPKEIKFPKEHLDFSANIANQTAASFYVDHKVLKQEKALELSQPDKQQLLMTTRYCIKYELGFCERFQKVRNDFREPLFLEDQNRKYRLSFDCKNCMMQIRME